MNYDWLLFFISAQLLFMQGDVWHQKGSSWRAVGNYLLAFVFLFSAMYLAWRQ